jgi:hypothetical protein
MSPVIILGLVLMWAVVLIPMWLRRHDEAEESRSVDRFSAAMHTLSRREAKVPDDRYVVMPHRSRSVEVHVSGASAAKRRTPRRISATQRRRRTLLGLMGLAATLLVAAVFTGSLIAWVLEVMVDAGLVSFVLHLRRMALVSAQLRRRQPVAARRVLSDAPPASAGPPSAAERQQQRRWDYARTDVGEYGEQVIVRRAEPPVEHVQVREPEPQTAIFDQATLAELDASAQPAAAEMATGLDSQEIFDQYTVPEPASQPVEQPPTEPSYAADSGPGFIEAGIVPGRRDALEPEPVTATAEVAREVPREPVTGVGGAPWQPVPVPRPTYTMKPTAPPRRARYASEDPLLPPAEPAAEFDTADQLEEILDRRWAVND